MDVKKLIDLVYEKSAIWDKGNNVHYNRATVNKCWKEISKAMGVHEAKLRKKWKYLRDQFGAESAKLRTEDEDVIVMPRWKHFNKLLFLKDTIKARGKLSSTMFTDSELVPNPKQEVLMDDNESSVENSPLPKPPEATSASSSSVAVPSVPVIKRRASTPAEELWNIDKQKLKYLESPAFTYEEEDHLLFFKSLLPHVRKIPETRVLNFRCRVQELLEQYAYDPSYQTSNNIPNCTNIKRSPSSDDD